MVIQSDNQVAIAYINRMGGGGGQPVAVTLPTGSRAVELVLRPRPHGRSGVPSRHTELYGRLPLSTSHRLERLEAPSRSVQRDPGGSSNTLQRRSLRSTHQPPAAMVRELASRPRSGSNGRVHPRLDRETALPVPAIRSDRSLREEDSPAASAKSGVGGTLVAGPALVPSPSTVSSGRSPAPPASTGSPVRSGRRDPPTDLPGHDAVGRVAAIRQRLECVGLSDSAANLILASWRSGTARAYSSAWRMWSRWCSEQSINTLTPPLAAVLNYLTDRFETGCQYRTVATQRSALSMTLAPVDGVPVGQNPLVARL